MKKTILTIGFVFIVAFQLKAQNHIHFTMDLGGNWSSFQYTNPSDYFKFEKKLRYNAALGIEIPFANIYSISPIIRYIAFSGKEQLVNSAFLNNIVNPSNVYATTDQHYLDLAVLLRYYTQDDFSGLYALFGPEIGYLIHARYLNHNPYQTGANANGDVSIDLKNYLYQWNFLAVGGLGYMFPDMNPQPYLQVNFALGLLKTSKETFSTNKWSTRGLLFNIGVRF